MAIDSVNAQTAGQVNPTAVQQTRPPEAVERGPDKDKDKDNNAGIQGVQSSKAPPPPNRGQNVDISA